MGWDIGMGWILKWVIQLGFDTGLGWDARF
jgi:hypothetical protein